jgi:pimeloyl-ACP methyl ester carboxylesterase
MAALAPDLRGYGDSSVPTDPAAYSILHIVGDLVALLDHLRLSKVPFFPPPHPVPAPISFVSTSPTGYRCG